ncbi:hypothetical protein OESDEN_03352 [Oesophagostomum dentatum]|uniref:Uncharacterized protein n=1 Tax=Oesophagostomum dentatum TaxID=61180 RepID=A0A0B1TMT4_OESDE|nr:hypothetical protein OESDEN_03352 [Oesophagostomum dentatum]
MQRQFKKVVVLLIDALRYDFMVPPEDDAPRSFFRGHMPGVKKLLERGAQIGLLLADPPTTTLQRIKAITTGTLPTFIDAGDNFAPSAIINEDNIFYQAHEKHLNVTFMGDNTWCMHRLQDSLRAAWTQFDLSLMRLGILSFVEALFFALSSRPMSAAQTVVRSGCLLLQLSVIFGGCNGNPAVPLLLAVLPLSTLLSLISMVSGLLTRRLMSYPMLFAYLCVFLHSVSYLSNSYVVYEAHVVRFLVQSILVVCAVAKAVSTNADRKAAAHAVLSPIQAIMSTFNTWDVGILLVSLLLLRSEPIFHRCREEEVNCQQYLPLELVTSLSSDAIFWRFVLATAVMYTLNCVVGRILPDSLPGSVRIARSLSWATHAFITLYHLVQLAPQTEVLQKRTQMLGIALALGVYGISVVAILMCICARE